MPTCDRKDKYQADEATDEYDCDDDSGGGDDAEMIPAEDIHYIDVEVKKEQQSPDVTPNKPPHNSSLGTSEVKHEEVIVVCGVCGYRGKGPTFEIHMDEHNDEADAYDFTPMYSIVSEWTKMEGYVGGTKDKCIKTYVCGQCPYRSYSYTNVKHHLEGCITDRPLFGCVVCGKAFKRKFLYKNHFREKHELNVNDESNERPKNSESCSDNTNLSEKQFVCECCSTFKTNSGQKYRQHRKTCTRKTVNTWECKECGKQMKEKRYLQAHIRRMHKMSHLKCPKCGASTGVKNRQKHIENCRGVKEAYELSVARVLKETGLRTTRSGENVGAETIPYQLEPPLEDSNSSIQTSANTPKQHAAEEDLTCQVCQHKGSGLAFQLHVISHNDEANQMNLDKHYTTITERIQIETLDGVIENKDISKYICLYCPFKAVSHESIRAHVETCIINRKLFGCHVCGNSYRQKRCLIFHFSKFHDEVPDPRGRREQKQITEQSDTSEMIGAEQNADKNSTEKKLYCACHFSTDSEDIFNTHSKICSIYIANKRESNQFGKTQKGTRCLDADKQSNVSHLKCRKCGEHTDEKNHDTHVAACLGDLYCYICDKYFKRALPLKKHMLAHEKAASAGKESSLSRNAENLQSVSESMDATNGSKGIRTSIFKQDVADVKNYKSRWKFQHKEPIATKDGHICERCSYTHKHKERIIRHQESCGVVEHTHKCNICGKLFKNERYLKLHVKAHKAGNLYPCSKCGCQFVGKKLFGEHSNRCRGTGKWYTCDVCTRTFNTLTNFKIHQDRHKKGTFKARRTPIYRHDNPKARTKNGNNVSMPGDAGCTEIPAENTTETSTCTSTETANLMTDPSSLKIEIPNVYSEMTADTEPEITTVNIGINAVTNSDTAPVGNTDIGADANQRIAVDLPFVDPASEMVEESADASYALIITENSQTGAENIYEMQVSKANN